MNKNLSRISYGLYTGRIGIPTKRVKLPYGACIVVGGLVQYRYCKYVERLYEVVSKDCATNVNPPGPLPLSSVKVEVQRATH